MCMFISQKYINKIQVIVILNNQHKAFCILLNLILESFVTNEMREVVGRNNQEH